MRNLKQILGGVLIIGTFFALGTGNAFAEVPNGRVSEEAPEPSADIVTAGDVEEQGDVDMGGGVIEESTETSESSEDEGIMLINDEGAEGAEADETEGTEVVTADDPVDEGFSNMDLEMWPVYLSLGGIAITLLLIFVINIIHRKSKK